MSDYSILQLYMGTITSDCDDYDATGARFGSEKEGYRRQSVRALSAQIERPRELSNNYNAN